MEIRELAEMIAEIVGYAGEVEWDTVCRCSAAGEPCAPEGEMRCASSTALAVCEGGAWSITECTCGADAPGYCVPDEGAGPACDCP